MLRRRVPISSSRALASATRFRQLRFAVIGKDVPDNLAQRIARQDQFDTESERRAAEPVVFVRVVLSVPCRLGKERDLTVSMTVVVPTKVVEGPTVHGSGHLQSSGSDLRCSRVSPGAPVFPVFPLTKHGVCCPVRSGQCQMEMSVSVTVLTFLSRTALSDTVLEELMAERGITVDHSTEHRRALKLLPIPSPQPASMHRSTHPA